MQSAFAIALLGAVASASSAIGMGRGANGEDFMEFIASKNKMYGSRAEFEERRALWMKSTQDIKQLRESSPNAKWGLTFLSDRTEEELAGWLGAKMDEEDRRMLDDIEYFSAEPRELQSLGAIDWTTSASLSPVKDQGGCGSCWVFNASVILETMVSLLVRPLVQPEVPARTGPPHRAEQQALQP